MLIRENLQLETLTQLVSFRNKYFILLKAPDEVCFIVDLITQPETKLNFKLQVEISSYFSSIKLHKFRENLVLLHLKIRMLKAMIIHNIFSLIAKGI